MHFFVRKRAARGRKRGIVDVQEGQTVGRALFVEPRQPRRNAARKFVHQGFPRYTATIPRPGRLRSAPSPFPFAGRVPQDLARRIGPRAAVQMGRPVRRARGARRMEGHAAAVMSRTRTPGPSIWQASRKCTGDRPATTCVLFGKWQEARATTRCDGGAELS